MANVLYIRATPKRDAQSFSLRLGQRFMVNYTALHPNDVVTELHLYRDVIPLIDGDVMDGWGKLARQEELKGHEQLKLHRLGELVDQFLASDMVVIAAPMWNFGYPPLLKAYIDAIAVAGKTFRYTDLGPIGLAGGKRIVILEARGSIYSAGAPFATSEHSASHLRAVFAFLGITDIDVLSAEGLALDPSAAEGIFEEAAVRADQLARHMTS